MKRIILFGVILALSVAAQAADKHDQHLQLDHHAQVAPDSPADSVAPMVAPEFAITHAATTITVSTGTARELAQKVAVEHVGEVAGPSASDDPLEPTGLLRGLSRPLASLYRFDPSTLPASLSDHVTSSLREQRAARHI